MLKNVTSITMILLNVMEDAFTSKYFHIAFILLLLYRYYYVTKNV